MKLEQAAASYLDWIEETRHLPADRWKTNLSTSAGTAERLYWATVYRGARMAFLMRTYGWKSAWARVRGEMQVRL
jgi:hypothetical protein